jgi:hypothetical protein
MARVNPMRPRAALLVVMAILCGCASEAARPDGGASLGDGAPSDRPTPVDVAIADALDPGEAGLPAGDPITQQPSRGTYQCTIQRGLTDHGLNWVTLRPALVTTSAGKAFLARLESMSDPTMPFMPAPPQLLSSTVDEAGTFGPSTVLPAGDAAQIVGVAAAPRGDGLLVVWQEDTKLRLVGLDASGQIAIPVKEVVAGADPAGGLRIAGGADGGFGLVYTAQVAMGAREPRFLVLGADGSSRTAPRVLTATPGSAYREPAPTITATPGGYAMIWRDPSSAEGGIDFAAADASGAELVPRRRISDPGHAGLEVGGIGAFDPATTALVSVAGGYVAAWTEVQAGSQMRGASAVVRLARLDSTGGRVGPAPLMRATTVDVDEVEPTLVPFGETIAVLWARGAHLYICGGCVPDHRMDLLLVDPVTLAPVSNQVSLATGGGERAGGLLRRQVAVLGESLLTTYLLTFHVNAKAGSAAFHCSKR